MNLKEKHEKLKDILKSYESVAIAFSGGVDSTFLLKTAHDVLGDKAIAITARSRSFPQRERNDGREFCEREGIRQIFCDTEELKVVSHNPPERCYLCKNEIISKLKATLAASDIGFEVKYVAEGTNMDDGNDYRPGHQAVIEHGLKSPLKEAGLYKAEIRELSNELGLKTWDRPSFACLMSRFVYGETITEKKLEMVEKAENLLLDAGFKQVRVRIHGTIARIETLTEDLPRIIEMAQQLSRELKSYGFTYVTLDLSGYRTGSMNETLSKELLGK